MAQTLQAVREAIYSALTSPQLSYVINNGAPIPLPVANVQAKTVWEVATPPSPLIAFSVSQRAPHSRYLYGERNLAIKIWITSLATEDEVTELFEATNAKIAFADQDAPIGTTGLSRIAAGNVLGVVFREIVPTRVSDVAFERESNRWYLVAEYNAAAV